MKKESSIIKGKTIVLPNDLKDLTYSDCIIRVMNIRSLENRLFINCKFLTPLKNTIIKNCKFFCCIFANDSAKDAKAENCEFHDCKGDKFQRIYTNNINIDEESVI